MRILWSSVKRVKVSAIKLKVKASTRKVSCILQLSSANVNTVAPPPPVHPHVNFSGENPPLPLSLWAIQFLAFVNKWHCKYGLNQTVGFSDLIIVWPGSGHYLLFSYHYYWEKIQGLWAIQFLAFLNKWHCKYGLNQTAGLLVSLIVNHWV